MLRKSADQFADAEISSGTSSSPSGAFEQLGRGTDDKEEGTPVWPASKWSSPLTDSTRIGRGKIIETMRRECLDAHADDVKKDMESVKGRSYDDSWLFPRPEIKTVKPENNPVAGPSTRNNHGFHPGNDDLYRPVDPSEINKTSGFVMKDDDFPPL